MNGLESVIGNLAVSTHSIKISGLTNLKIASIISKEPTPLAMAVRKDWPELVSIFNKALESISEEERFEITSQWVPVEYTKELLPSIDIDIRIFEDSLRDLVGDTVILSNNRVLEKFINEESKLIRQELKKDVEQDFLIFVQNKPRYYQLRYIDETGQEIIRIDNDGEKIQVVPKKDLQNKKDRYYFTDTIKLNKGDIYISPFDLNIEEGELENRGTEEDPIYVSVVRYSTPVFDENNQNKGIIIINIHGDWIKNTLVELTNENNKFYLINQDGHFLHHPNKNKEFLFMFGKDPSLEDYFGEDSSRIVLNKKSGNFVFNDRVFTFKRVPSDLKVENFWVLVHEKPFEGAGLHLSPREQVWLQDHKDMRLGHDINWPPFDFEDELGAYQGICSDYVSIVSDLLDVNIIHAEQTKGLSWAKMIEKAKQGKVDVIPCITKTDERSEYLFFTKPYLELPNILITRDDSPLIVDFSEMQGRSMAIIQGFAHEEFLKKDYPGIIQIQAGNLEEALQLVSKGKAYGAMSTFASLEYTTKKLGIKNLKISATTPYSIDLSFAVKKDWLEMIPILEKTLDTFSKEDKKNIQDKWTTALVETRIDWKRIWQITGITAAISVLIITIIIIWNRKLAKEITRRRAAEEKILDEKNFSEALTNSLPGIFFFIDKEGKFLKWNKNLEKITKYNAKEILKMNAFQFFLGKDKKLIAKKMETVFKKGEASIELEVVAKDGEKTPFYFNGIRILKEKDSYIVGIGMDLSKVKKMEKALEISEERFKFITMISHQLRTPVSSAKLILEMMADKDETGEAKNAFYKINNLNNIIGTLLFYIQNREKLEQLKGSKEKIDLIKIIKDQISSLKSSIADKKIIVTQKLPKKVLVKGEQVILNRILYSILQNAIVYNKEHGNIDISIKEEQGNILLEIKDTGYGIPKKEQNKIFTEYFRASNASFGLNEGSGLSLFLASIMIKLLGGEVYFKSIENKESTFYLRFPISKTKKDFK